MDSNVELLKSILSHKNIQISLRCSGERKSSGKKYLHSAEKNSDAKSDVECVEVQTVVKNSDFFDSLFTGHPLNAVGDINDFYYFLLARKISKMLKVDSQICSQNNSQSLTGIADKAADIYKQGKRYAINYINEHKEEIFSKAQPDYDLRYAALDSVIELQGAIHKDVFNCMCQECSSMIIERFDDLESVFDKSENADLFNALFPSGHYLPVDNLLGQKLIDSLWLQIVLDIWKKEYFKNNGHRVLIVRYAAELCQDAGVLCDNLSEWNVYEAETAVKSLWAFLNEIKSYKSNDVSVHITTVEKLIRKILDKEVTIVQNLFDHIGAKEWRTTRGSKSKLLLLTHYDNYESYLSKETESSQNKNCTEVPVDKFFSTDYRRKLSRLEAYKVAYFLEILADQAACEVYSGLVYDIVRYISGKMSKQEEGGLAEDAEMMLGMVHLVYRNQNNTSQEQTVFCYSLCVFLCSLSEKLLRMFYCHLTGYKDTANITLGELLNEKKVLADAFGCSHVRSLAYFLTSTPGIKLGRNYRNNLAHWSSGLASCGMTKNFTSCLLWLFTDILNSVLIYFDSRTVVVHCSSQPICEHQQSACPK